MERNMGDNTYVMDVRLKREYATGYMGRFGSWWRHTETL